MMTSNSSTAKEHSLIMDVELRSLVNFGILEERETMTLFDRFGSSKLELSIFLKGSQITGFIIFYFRQAKLKAAN